MATATATAMAMAVAVAVAVALVLVLAPVLAGLVCVFSGMQMNVMPVRLSQEISRLVGVVEI